MTVSKEDITFCSRTAHRRLAKTVLEVEWLILATPTGEKRNKLTEANIHLQVAMNLLPDLP